MLILYEARERAGRVRKQVKIENEREVELTLRVLLAL